MTWKDALKAVVKANRRFRHCAKAGVKGARASERVTAKDPHIQTIRAQKKFNP